MGLEHDNVQKNPNPDMNNQEHQRQAEYKHGDADVINMFEDIGYDTLTGASDSEAFIKLSKEIERLSALPEANVMTGIKTVIIPDTNLPLPVLALTATIDGTTVVYSLLIESMLNMVLKPGIEKLNNQQMQGGAGDYEIIHDKPASRCYGDTMRKIITQNVAMRLNVPADTILHVHGCVIPKTANLESDIVARMYFDTGALCLRNYLGRDKVQSITHKVLRTSGWAVRQSTVITPGGNKRNKSDQPIYADFSIGLGISKYVNDNKYSEEIRAAERKYTLADVKGFIDFNPHVPQDVPPNAPMPLSQTGYIPLVILTEISGLSENKKTIEDLRTQLLGLTTTASLIDSHGWVRIFEKWLNSKNSEKTSLGHLGIEHDPFCGLGQPQLGMVKVESLSQSTVPKDGIMTPITVANAWCTQGAAVALDVEKGGRLEWIQDVFVSAAGASGDESASMHNNELIINECDALTNGKFSELWTTLHNGQRASVVVQSTVQVHLGTYTDKDGNERDIRTLDYLTMLSRLPKDLEKLSLATTAQIPGKCTPATLTQRRKTVEQLADGEVNFTGMATRVFMAPGFIQVLITALSNAGVTYINDDILGYDNDISRIGMNIDLASSVNAGGFYSSGFGQGPSVNQSFAVNSFTNPRYS